MKLIYGRAGTGKSEYVFKDIKNKIDQGIKNKIYIITPEQFSFTAEKTLLEKFESGSSMQVEVLSFERMAYRVINECISDSYFQLEKSSKAMIVYDALNKNKSKLNFLGRSLENVETILTEITELKKHNITIEMLENGLDKIENKYLQAKLSDILIMYKALEEKIKDDFIDENDLLTILEKYIAKSHLFDNAIFYIDEFSGFTKQEFSVIKKLNEIANEIYITICLDKLPEKKEDMEGYYQNNVNPESDIFYDNEQTYETLNDMFNIKEDDKIKLSEAYRFKNQELIHLEKNIFDIPYKQYNENVENIELFLAQNSYEEINYVANQIIKLVRDDGYKFNDIAVICNDIESYVGQIKVIFDEYNIPVYIDEKKDITQNILIKYVLSILEIFSKSWSFESVFNYLKTGIPNIENIYELENYCLKWGIQGKKFYQNDWNYEQGEDSNNYNKEQHKIVDSLIELQENLKENKTIKEISKKIYEFLIDSLKNSDSKIIENDDAKDAFKLVTDVLNEMIKIFGDEKISFENYLKLLKIGLSEKELGQIPNSQDNVVVEDVNRSKTHKVKAMFIIGVNDGVFPRVNNAEGFLNNKDREILKDNGLEIAKGTKEKSYEENFNIYKAFSTAEEKVFVSYSASDSDGKGLRRSLIISRLRRIFPKLIENSKLDNGENIENEVITKDITFSKLLNNIENENWLEVYKWYEEHEKQKLQNALNGIEYSNLPQKINEKNIDKLYGNNLFTSVSKLESYMGCAFSYYLKYGLKLSEKEKLEIKPLDTGSFMHDVIDKFFKYLNENNLKTYEIDDEKLEQIVNKIVEEKLGTNSKFNLTAKYQILVQRLKKVLVMSLKYILNSINQSNFEVLGTEVEFDKDDEAKYPPIEMTLENGKRVSIVGKIDRVDIAKLADGTYIRIIDYKSSTHDIDLNKVISGLQLQLITYIDAMCKNEKVEPAGALYFTLLEPKIAEKNIDEEEARKLIEENYKMDGLVLANVDVIKAMDNKLKTGKSNIIPVTLNGSGDITQTKSSTITREEFEKLQKYVVKLIKKISNEILTGNIEMKPYYNAKGKNTPCQFCPYKSICQFDQKLAGNDYRYIPNKNKKEILEYLKNT